jgi:hypothetical protein
MSGLNLPHPVFSRAGLAALQESRPLPRTPLTVHIPNHYGPVGADVVPVPPNPSSPSRFVSKEAFNRWCVQVGASIRWYRRLTNTV